MDKVLLIQDGSDARLKTLLPSKYSVKTIPSEDSFLVKFKKADLVILDSSLNGESIRVCKKLRRDRVELPIIAMLQFESKEERIGLLREGADDVLSEPVEQEELEAKIYSLLRRPPIFLDHILSSSSLSLDLKSKQAIRGKKEIVLTKKEFSLLNVLLRNRGQLVSRGILLDEVWGDEMEIGTNIVDVYIRYLRRKIDDGYKKKLIHSVHGFGYRIEE